MALLSEPVTVTCHDGIRRHASALQVDLITDRVYVRFDVPFEHTCGWIDIEDIEHSGGRE